MVRKQGGDNSEFEEYLRHMELIIDMCNDIKQSSHYDVRKVFQESIERLNDQL